MTTKNIRPVCERCGEPVPRRSRSPNLYLLPPLDNALVHLFKVQNVANVCRCKPDVAVATDSSSLAPPQVRRSKSLCREPTSNNQMVNFIRQQHEPEILLGSTGSGYGGVGLNEIGSGMIKSSVTVRQSVPISAGLREPSSSLGVNRINLAHQRSRDDSGGGELRTNFTKSETEWNSSRDDNDGQDEISLNNNLHYVTRKNLEEYGWMAERFFEATAGVHADNVQKYCQMFLEHWEQQQPVLASPVNFFYQMFVFLFPRYLKEMTPCQHQAKCKPEMKSLLLQFETTAVGILKSFGEAIGMDRNTDLQVQLLSAVEWFTFYNRVWSPFAALVIDTLWCRSVVDTAAIGEWRRLEYPPMAVAEFPSGVARGATNYIENFPHYRQQLLASVEPKRKPPEAPAAKIVHRK